MPSQMSVLFIKTFCYVHQLLRERADHVQFSFESTSKFPLQLRCRLQEMLHLRVWVLNVLGRIRSLSIPGPLLRQFGCQLALKHLCDVLAKHGEELEAVERTASCDVEAL